jgi:hypothetical protein
MTDKIMAEYSEKNPNFYDGYWRKNPRRDAKCNPILYRDNYKPYFKSDLNYRLSNQNPCNVEGFQNLNSNSNSNPNNQSNIQVVKNTNNSVENNTPQKIMKNSADLENYAQVHNISCDGQKASVTFNQCNTKTKKMYDIDLPSIMKKEVIGDIEEIDRIHNKKIKNGILYGDIKLQHLRNTMQKLHYQMNPMMLKAHEIDFRREGFFRDTK